jgi:hypothetical protein
MAFDIFEIFRIILQSLQGISILIIIFGMVSAFLWKVAFYIQLALGLILTIIATYFVYSFTQMLRLPATWAILIFIIGIIASLIQAARAAIMAIVNGFFLTWLGTLLFLAMGQALDPIGLITHLSGTIIISAIIAMILVAIAAYAGGHLTSIFKFPKLTRQKTYKSDYEEKPRPYTSSSQRSSRTAYAEHRSQESREPSTLAAEAEEEEIRITLSQNPTASHCGICEEEWLIDSEIFRCPKCGTNFHSDCIKEYLNKEHSCPKCHARARLSLN